MYLCFTARICILNKESQAYWNSENIVFYELLNPQQVEGVIEHLKLLETERQLVQN
jgi:hypothetical protein